MAEPTNPNAHEALAALVTNPHPEAPMALNAMHATGLSFMEILTLMLNYGPQLMTIFSQAGKYFAWIQSVVSAIKAGQPLPPLPA